MTTDELREAVRKWDGDYFMALDICGAAFDLYVRPSEITQVSYKPNYDETLPEWVKELAKADFIYADDAIYKARVMLDFARADEMEVSDASHNDTEP